MTQVATQTAQVLAYVTLKSTNLTYTLYPVASRTSDATYAVWTINGKPTHCTCKDRKFRPWKMCDHMTQWLQEGKQETPACPVSQELKTVFGSVEEEFEYRLGAYGKKIAYEWLYEQKHEAATVSPDEAAAVEGAKVEARYFEQLRAMDEQYASDPRRGLSQAEVETAKANSRMFYDGL